MTVVALTADQLRLTVDPARLGFATTSEWIGLPLPWIGQARAETAARFGLQMRQPGYNLMVLGEVGTGRKSLLTQLMHEQAAQRPVPPDLCFLNNFDQPEQPFHLRLPAGQGRRLRQRMAAWAREIQVLVPQCLQQDEFLAERRRLTQAAKVMSDKAYAALTASAQAQHFDWVRDEGRMVFTLKDAQGEPVTAASAQQLSPAERAAMDAAEEALRAEIDIYLEATLSRERALTLAISDLRQRHLRPVLARGLVQLGQELSASGDQADKLQRYLAQVLQCVLDQHAVLIPGHDEGQPQEEREALLSLLRVNVAVDHHGACGAPVIIEDNPVFRNLFGSIDYTSDGGDLVTDFAQIRAGSLLRAHGGFLMLHLQDLMNDASVWERLRRMMRSGLVQLDEPGAMPNALSAVALFPEAVAVDVKLVLMASVQAYCAVQELDPEWAWRFRCKVDFADSFKATPQTERAIAVGVAHTCERLGLLHFSAAAVAQIIEDSHREAGDQTRQSARVGLTEAWMVESHAQAQTRGAARVEAQDVQAARQARLARLAGLEMLVQDTIASGERLLAVHGERVAQINGLTVMDMGDHCFGLPVRITARSYAGDEGLLNIEREVEMSGPIHDKGVLILHSYLSGLFAHMAPLSLNAAVVFEQEYGGVEGDSASCAELYALLSSLSGVPLRQGIAVTGAVNQHGDLLPVGSINEKIEGYFRSCELLGLDGQQGVLMPALNRRHLMLAPQVVQAVAQGRFHIHVADQVGDGLSLLTGLPFGHWGPGGYAAGTLLGRVQATLQRFRRACEALLAHRPAPRRRTRR